jgi:ABC-type polysaccharide/polyol phosphate transport system ATPase subunit
MASIILDHVSVSFPIYSSATRSIKNRLIQSATGGQIRSESGSDRISVVQALQDINLHFETGDRIGLVGHNGAGKTTLLRVLGGIYEPNEGLVSVQGATVPLFDISLGMDPESTGYENIVLRGLYLGLSRSAMRLRLDEIADFTELGDFLNLPIRTYSAGMRMRLAFAVSTSVAPDILLIDEGIGAGDAAFLQKASERLKLFTEQVSIIVLSSHSEDLILKMCNKALLMEHGRVIDSGPVAEVLSRYRELRDGSDKTKTTKTTKTDAKPKPDAAAAGSGVRGGRPYSDLEHVPGVLESDAHDDAPEAGPCSRSWVAQTARLLRERRWNDVDLDGLLRVVESLDDQRVDAIEAQLAYLLLQLLTWHYRESERSELRRDLIHQIRGQIELMMKTDQRFADAASMDLERAYRKARACAARDLALESTQLPKECPITMTRVLDRSWLPGDPPSASGVFRRAPTGA